jgi:cell wall-associated NlpC family hydrolase
MLVTGLGQRAPSWVTYTMVQDAMLHFRSCYPDEGCGVFKASGFVPLPNVADQHRDDQGAVLDPRLAFVIDPAAWADQDSSNDPVLAVVHSHTNGAEMPGRADMAGQAQTGVPWAIFVTDGDVVGEPIWFGDQLAILPLFERPFVHGISDCYSLIRDAYRLGRAALRDDSLPPDHRIYGWPHEPVTLLMAERDDNWWDNGQNLYDENWQRAGFVSIAAGAGALPTELQVGDVFLARVRSPVVNHGGLYVGNGLILHHVAGYNSHRTVLNLWQSRIERWLRYVPQEQ